MTTAEEILARVAVPETEPHIVIGKDRIITIPPELRTIAVQFDHNIETVTFDCPRYWDNHDMSKMKVYINYKLPNNILGSYHAADLVVDEDCNSIMHFTWTISRNVTQVVGTITFLVCIKSIDENGDESLHWNSELNQDMQVSAGLECHEVVVEKHHDVITYLLTLLGKTGDTSPVAVVEEVEGGVRFTVTDKNGITTALIRNGAVGPQGPKGDPGYAPVVGKDYFTDSDIDLIVDRVLPRIPVYDDSVTKGAL